MTAEIIVRDRQGFLSRAECDVSILSREIGSTVIVEEYVAGILYEVPHKLKLIVYGQDKSSIFYDILPDQAKRKSL